MTAAGGDKAGGTLATHRQPTYTHFEVEAEYPQTKRICSMYKEAQEGV